MGVTGEKRCAIFQNTRTDKIHSGLKRNFWKNNKMIKPAATVGGLTNTLTSN